MPKKRKRVHVTVRLTQGQENRTWMLRRVAVKILNPTMNIVENSAMFMQRHYDLRVSGDAAEIPDLRVHVVFNLDEDAEHD